LYTGLPYDVLALRLQTLPWVGVVKGTWHLLILGNKW